MPRLLTSEQVLAMPTGLLFECLGEQLDGPRAAEQPQRLLLTLAARDVSYPLDVHHGVLHAAPTETPPAGLPQVRFTLRAFAGPLLGDVTSADVEEDLTDPTGSLIDLLSLFDPPQFWFGLAVPAVYAVPAPRPGAEGGEAAAPRRYG